MITRRTLLKSAAAAAASVTSATMPFPAIGQGTKFTLSLPSAPVEEAVRGVRL